MKRETKLLILIILILATGLSILNFVSISFIKEEMERRISHEVALYRELASREVNFKLPEYLTVSSDIKEISHNKQLIAKVGNKYIFLSRNYFSNRLNRLALILFFWEAAILIVSTLLIYKLAESSIQNETRTKEFLRLLFLVFAHKLGNFLSVNRLNLEILKERCSKEKPLDRLKKGYQILETDFKRVLSQISSMETEERIEDIDLKSLVMEIVEQLKPYLMGQNLHLHLEDVRVKASPKDVESLFFFLLENAFKYSSSRIKISLKKNRNGFVLKVKNDIGQNGKSGSGIGLKLAQFLAAKYNWKLKYEIEDNEYVTTLLS